MSLRQTIGSHLWPTLLAVVSSAPFLLFLAAFSIVARYSLSSPDSVGGLNVEMGLENYQRVFSDAYYLKIFGNTIKISLLVTGLALVLGYPVAYAIATSRIGDVLLFLVVLPMLADILVRAYGWIVILASGGVINSVLVGSGLTTTPLRMFPSEFAVSVALLHEVMPFAILPIVASLRQINPNLREAALLLYANEWRAFLAVTLPLSMPGILSGSLLTLAMCISTFAVPLLLGGGTVQMVSMAIAEQMTVTLNWPLGSALVIVLVALVLALTYAYSVATRRVGVDK